MIFEMFLSIRHKPLMAECNKYVTINKDTGERIPYVIWANDETGRYRQYLADQNGVVGVVDKVRGRIKSRIFTGNIELRKTGHAPVG